MPEILSTSADTVNYQKWENSKRVNGRLKITAHPFTMWRYKIKRRHLIEDHQDVCRGVRSTCTNVPFDPLYQIAYLNGVPNMIKFQPIWNRLDSESYARFRGKLYKGSAALGVTLGSYKQSREMIVNRCQQLHRPLDALFDAIRKSPKGAPGYAEKVSGQYLEYIFGMVPLYQDIIAASTTVIQQGAQIHFVRASSRASGHHQSSYVPGPYGTGLTNDDVVYSLRCTRAALVRVSNPNLWLAERAGSLNMAAVAWDLVPWSFVVNMFVNTGQLVNSITDFAGLTFEEESTTNTCAAKLRSVSYTPLNAKCYNFLPGGMVRCSETEFETRSKSRILGAVARPPLQFKIPKANWELAAMAASLVTQKVSRVARLLRR